jgi:hypothetical protein
MNSLKQKKLCKHIIYRVLALIAFLKAVWTGLELITETPLNTILLINFINFVDRFVDLIFHIP